MKIENSDQRYIRFDGILQENMQFEFRRGWETTRIHRRPDKGTGEYTLELLDNNERPLIRVSPNVDFQVGCMGSENDSMAATRIVDYIPYHPEARQLLFRREDYIIFKATVAPDSPVIELVTVEPGKENQLHLKWSAKSDSDRPLTFNIVYTLNGKRFFPLAKDLEESKATVDLNSIPGGNEAQVAVLATDGIRSSFAMSDVFETEEKLPKILIQQPEDNASLPPDQPVSFIGQALDVAGAPLSDKPLVWEVDGEEIAEGTRLAMATNLEPGKHEAILYYRSESKQQLSASVAFIINKRNEAQERFQQILDRLK